MKIIKYPYYFLVTSSHKLFQPQGIPVLMYHSISDTPTTLSVSPKNFEHQLDIIKQMGYQSITPPALLDYFNQQIFPAKKVLITFDDGFKDCLQFALPLLKRYGLNASFFISGQLLGRQNPNYKHRLDTQKTLINQTELKQLADDNHIVANHFYSHTPLIELDQAAIASQYHNNIDFCQHHDYVAYPKNKTNQAVVNTLKSLGIKLAFSGYNRVATPKDQPLNIPRIQVFNSDVGLKFKAKLSPFYGIYKKSVLV